LASLDSNQPSFPIECLVGNHPNPRAAREMEANKIPTVICRRLLVPLVFFSETEDAGDGQSRRGGWVREGAWGDGFHYGGGATPILTLRPSAAAFHGLLVRSFPFVPFVRFLPSAIASFFFSFSSFPIAGASFSLRLCNCVVKRGALFGEYVGPPVTSWRTSVVSGFPTLQLDISHGESHVTVTILISLKPRPRSCTQSLVSYFFSRFTAR